ncbi:MAG: hypothetical protein COT34_02685 [Candidatus Nealsonbacteria bacterium CG08_land_8_20_14_0_20_43_11]|uniref:30S ribosomal protein S21 n=1 Tax=Candidatus Nealsonbacteria bacterium CG08_land_8_20_14_0_20_43_11 TaxID=1974706 RepID=A0A2M6T032_9BACT|nr:MAG: hypothetical protein COT34_02685 [Candidatus Nealsonbacteria bacterium CG08_land_8_20_14_0_20_43_11]
MALEVKKQERETPQSLLRRFSKTVRQSGILLRAREGRFRKREKSKQMTKQAALRREMLKKEYLKLAKLGKLESKRRGNRR